MRSCEKAPKIIKLTKGFLLFTSSSVLSFSLSSSLCQGSKERMGGDSFHSSPASHYEWKLKRYIQDEQHRRSLDFPTGFFFFHNGNSYLNVNCNSKDSAIP